MVNIEWKSKSSVPYDGNLKSYLSRVRNIDDVNLFLNPSSKSTHSPLLLKNIREAIHRIELAIKNNEKIVVVADPDP